MDWKRVDLGGFVAISRLCGEYFIQDVGRLPASGYRVKVFERREDFLALPNIRVRLPDGTVDGISGLGQTELEALQDVIIGVGELLSSRDVWAEADLDWADPRDF